MYHVRTHLRMNTFRYSRWRYVREWFTVPSYPWNMDTMVSEETGSVDRVIYNFTQLTHLTCLSTVAFSSPVGRTCVHTDRMKQTLGLHLYVRYTHRRRLEPSTLALGSFRSVFLHFFKKLTYTDQMLQYHWGTWGQCCAV